MTQPGADPWHGTHPDTEAGKPNTTDPHGPENHTPTKAPTPTTEPPPRPPDDTTAGPTSPEPSTKPSEFHATPATENEPQPATPTPKSATPDTDSANSDDPNTTTPNSTNPHANIDPSQSDASDGRPKSATASSLPDILETLVLGPEDQLVIRLPQYTTMEQYARVRELIPAAFADRVLLVAGVEQLAVLRKE